MRNRVFFVSLIALFCSPAKADILLPLPIYSNLAIGLGSDYHETVESSFLPAGINYVSSNGSMLAVGSSAGEPVPSGNAHVSASGLTNQFSALANGRYDYFFRVLSDENRQLMIDLNPTFSWNVSNDGFGIRSGGSWSLYQEFSNDILASSGFRVFCTGFTKCISGSKSESVITKIQTNVTYRVQVLGAARVFADGVHTFSGSAKSSTSIVALGLTPGETLKFGMASVPELSTWLTMIAGFVVVGALIRLRRSMGYANEI